MWTIRSCMRRIDALWVVQILEGTVSTACQHLSMMHRLIDSVALLDMLASFALAVSTFCAGHHVHSLLHILHFGQTDH